MKRLTFSLSLFIVGFSLLVLQVVSPLALAKTSVPASVSCTPCNANNEWNNSFTGLDTEFTVSNPSFHDSLGYFDRYIQLGYNGLNHVTMGITKTGSSDNGDFCTGSANNLYYFYQYNQNNAVCFNVPSGDINHEKEFKMAYYVSNGGGMFFQGTDFCVNGCFVGGIAESYQPAFFAERILDSSLSGHEVWGSEWFNNLYDETSGWSFFSTSGTDRPANPPQMYWHIAPGGSFQGGELFSCDYDSGTLCTYGS